MTLYIWSFECGKCQEQVLMCTRCLCGRRYCRGCAAAAAWDSKRCARRRYQRTPKGRWSGRERSRRYREKIAQRRAAGGPSQTASADDAADKGTPAPTGDGEAAGRPSDSATLVRVTDRSVGLVRGLCARVALAPTVVPLTVTAPRGAEETSDAEGKCDELAATSAGGEGKASAPRDATRVQAQCSCCGRIGELVVFDGRARLVRAPVKPWDEDEPGP